MLTLALHTLHEELGARFAGIGGDAGGEVVRDYGDLRAEYTALHETVGVIDLGSRSRLVLAGPDRQRFLHGQVTNNVVDLDPGEGCYAALVTAKGRMQSDLNIYCLPEELLLDFEPGLAATVSDRLNKYIIADQVELFDVANAYGLLSVQGPQSAALIQALNLEFSVPSQMLAFAHLHHPQFGELCCVNHPRSRTLGFDLFLPLAALAEIAPRLHAAARELGGRPCGWDALEMVRIEAGIPRFGADMDETNLPPETGIEQRAISYTKGCYIGQEVIARIRTYGQVARALRGLRLAADLRELPGRGDKLLADAKEVGSVTSALASPALGANLALAYVRREHNAIGNTLRLVTAAGESQARIVPLPFAAE